jgi:hypothetical protein
MDPAFSLIPARSEAAGFHAIGLEQSQYSRSPEVFAMGFFTIWL